MERLSLILLVFVRDWPTEENVIAAKVGPNNVLVDTKRVLLNRPLSMPLILSGSRFELEMLGMLHLGAMHLLNLGEGHVRVLISGCTEI